MKKIVSFLIGFFIGAGIAGVITLLFTPMAGKDVQGKVKGEIDKVVHEIKLASEQRQEELKEELAILRQGKRIQLESVDE